MKTALTLIITGTLVLGVSAGLLHDSLTGRDPETASAGGRTPVGSEPASRPVRVARIYIPRLHLASRLYWDVDDGPAWWSRTGRPFGGDTVAVAGHRTTHSRPFYHLERLRRGDRVYLAWRGRTRAYGVTGSRIYPATDQHIGDSRGREVLLLSACTPRGSARYRLVVYAQPLLSSS